MSLEQLGSKYHRFYSIRSDIHGVDPILDKVCLAVHEITSYSTHTISEDERAAPDLIAIREYGSDAFWWIILAYNGIGSNKDLVEGRVLRIPDYASVIALITKNTVRPDRIQRVITI